MSHHAVIVIGPDPAQRAQQHFFSRYPPGYEMRVDAAIGGRYTGNLPAVPGAASARVCGDAPAGAEAALGAQLLGMPGVTMQRLTYYGPHFDQAEAADVDIDAINWLPDAVIEADGTVHDEPAKAGTTENRGQPFAVIEASYAEHGQQWAEQDARAAAEWLEQVHALLRSARPRDLVTVVDVHE